MSVIIDISRFISRAHLPFDTGIDRVERAAILDAMARFQNPYFVARTGQGYVLMNRQQMGGFMDQESTQTWPKARGKNRLRLKLSPSQRRVRTALDNLGVIPFDLKSLNTVLVAQGLTLVHYLNFGHANLGRQFLTTLADCETRDISIFLHDVIPLDFPQYCRPDKVASFKSSFENTLEFGTQILCNSNYTSQRISAQANGMDAKVNIQTIPLHTPDLNTETLTPRHINDRPTFAMLGTIEPRKNLGFLLDIWDDLGLTMTADQMPNLLIMGKRGWESRDVFNRLDAAIEMGFVFEENDLDDKSVQEYLIGCHALLFPSHVEGYGLPAQEAIALNVPVIGADIPVFRELFADTAELISTHNTDAWIASLEKHMNRALGSKETSLLPSNSSSWQSFFDKVYKNQHTE